jgi:hypothetical protein
MSPLIHDRGPAARIKTPGVRRVCRRALPCAAILIAGVLSGCTAPLETSLQRLVEARQRSADLVVHFTAAADAGNRAVMADTDQSSIAFAREASQATEAAEKDADALAPMFEALGYAEESRLLKEFDMRFAEFRSLDKNVLELAVANTNIKAQQLAFGPAQASVDEFSHALEAVADAAGESNWRAQALVARTLAEVREIQVLQAPHIAEATDAAMTRMEAHMTASEKSARASLQMLASLTPPSATPRLAAATAALDRFIDLNRQIVALSRQNTNVRSLSLALGHKRMLTTGCQDSLRALQETLAKRGYTATR